MITTDVISSSRSKNLERLSKEPILITHHSYRKEKNPLEESDHRYEDESTDPFKDWCMPEEPGGYIRPSKHILL
jgi:hypothetical protein